MDSAIKKADEKLAFISKDKEALRLYHLRERALSDWTSGVNHAKREASLEIAENLLDVLDVQTIAQKTGVSIKTLEKMKQNKEQADF